MGGSSGSATRDPYAPATTAVAPAATTSDTPAAPAAPSGPGASAETPGFTSDAGTGQPIAFSERWTAEKVVPGRIATAPDGSMVLDARFTIRGKGTREDPYELPWDVVTSAQETYNPRAGKRRIPQRLAFLDGAFVRITGFIAFPITTSNPREMLVMLNQWDGCCIGVPPTAYDAIEVKLATAARSDQRQAVNGHLVGRFKLDPFEDQGWLLGLYVLEDATLTTDH